MHARAPGSLTMKLSSTQVTNVARWWQDLTPAERHHLRRDRGRPPVGVIARFVDPALPDEMEDGTTDFYEYLVNHELSFREGRTFHICSAHPEARAVLAAGKIPADFRCPRADAACPMRALLDAAPGCDVRLSLRGRCA